MRRLFEKVLPPKTGLAVVVKAGQQRQNPKTPGPYLSLDALTEGYDTMDLFVNVQHDLARGGWVIEEPEFCAEMDCVVGLSNCPLDVIAPCNAYHCTPVNAEIYGA